MTRSIQRSKCARSCGMCDPGKYEAGKAKASDRRRMQDDGEASDLSPDSARALDELENMLDEIEKGIDADVCRTPQATEKEK